MDEKILDLMLRRFSHLRLSPMKSSKVNRRKFIHYSAALTSSVVLAPVVLMPLLQKTIYNGTCTGIIAH